MSKPRAPKPAIKPVTDAPPKGASKAAPKNTSAAKDEAAAPKKAGKEAALETAREEGATGSGVADPSPAPDSSPAANSQPPAEAKEKPARPRPHPDPTRYGDWEKNGRAIDF